MEKHRRNLADLIAASEDYLMERILGYAIAYDFARYTSTLKEAWRLSISGLSHSLITALKGAGQDLELGPNSRYEDDPIAAFGIEEARRHRERGIDLAMFLGLFKYYRQSYLDLVAISKQGEPVKAVYRNLVNRCFDRIEIGLAVEWASISGEKRVGELQAHNRYMTNEKNKYLTLFESLPNPVLFLNLENRVDHMNQAAAELLGEAADSRARYYSPDRNRYLEFNGFDRTGNSEATLGAEVETLIPWISEDIGAFVNAAASTAFVEKQVAFGEEERWFQIKFSKMLDVSGKFHGTILHLEDISGLRRAETEREKTIRKLQDALVEVNTLSGLLPICSFCKNIRDDNGYWNRIEAYISEHSDARFSHSLCPDCAREHYPEFDLCNKGKGNSC